MENITQNKFDGLEHKVYNRPNITSALHLLNVILNKLQQYKIDAQVRLINNN